MNIDEKNLSQVSPWLKEYLDKIKIKEERIKIMMSSAIYFEWLNKFMNDKDSFSDSDWLYSPEELSESDTKNVNDLCLFYEGIKKYADQNYIYAKPCDFGNYYKVKLNDNAYIIGILVGQGTIFFCKKALLNDKKDYIDFIDIINNKQQNNVSQINTVLETLTQMITAIYECGVPIEAITDTVNTAIEDINNKIDYGDKKQAR